jgi:hypothetical protein
MRPVVFYRSPLMKSEEFDAARAAGFTCVPSRMWVQKGDLVIARYSALPYYKELVADIEYVGAQLVNTLHQHCWIADMRNWVEDLADLTPQTWYRPEDVPAEELGPFVLKGETNSRKDLWKTHAFAADKKAVWDVYNRLVTDGFLEFSSQDIYVRKYIPLVTYARGINDIPVTKEFRFFVCRRQVLSGAYYWDSWGDTCLEADPTWKEPSVDEVPPAFLQEVVERVGDRAAFYAVDIGQDVEGRWWVIEVNDGQMSGLSGNKPEVVYPRLFKALTG